jgi:hypothetical protein
LHDPYGRSHWAAFLLLDLLGMVFNMSVEISVEKQESTLVSD